MKHSAELEKYVRDTGLAIKQNPPCTWPAYQADPIRCWRYVMRCFGAGLDAFPEEQVEDIVKTLYGRWFIASELHHQIPDVSNKEFTGWIIDAMRERKAQQAASA